MRSVGVLPDDTADLPDRSNHITGWSTVDGKPITAKNIFAAWNAKGLPMTKKPDEKVADADRGDSGRRRSKKDGKSATYSKHFAGWTSNGTPTMMKTEGEDSEQSADVNNTELPRRSRYPGTRVRITIADGYPNAQGQRVDRDLSVFILPWEKQEVPTAHLKVIADFAFKLHKTINFGTAHQRSGTDQIYAEATSLNPEVRVIDIPKGQVEGTEGCETWISVGDPQAWRSGHSYHRVKA